ncbi:MAG TPA: hypothetical protein VE398_08020 [Acidobacteriota bacterium]|nr:hypothetical protein [Acidobacteriota bacterium]
MTRERGPRTAAAVALLALALVVSPAVTAQMPRREPTPNDTLKSPEILSDHRVTFRIYAPKASDVSISGDWINWRHYLNDYAQLLFR